MAKKHSQYISVHPGLERQYPMASARLMIDPCEGEMGYFPAGLPAALVESWGLGVAVWNLGLGSWVQTKDNSGTIAAGASGFVLTSQASPSANDDVCLNSAGGRVVAAQKVFTFTSQWQVSSVNASTGVGVTCGLVTNGSTEIQTADPADGVFLIMVPGTSTLKLRTIAAAGTPHDQTISTGIAAATEYRATIVFKSGASAADSFGGLYFAAYADGVQGTYYPFTTLQTADVFAWLSSPPTLSGHFAQRLKGTTQRSATLRHFLGQADL